MDLESNDSRMSLINILEANLEKGDSKAVIARVLLRYFYNIPNMTQEHIAKLSFVAPSTIGRFCKKIGYKNFIEFRKYVNEYIEKLKMDSMLSDAFYEVADKDVFSFSDEIFSSTMKSLYNAQKSIDIETIDKVTDLIISTEKIAVFGLPISQIMGKDFQYHMLRHGKYMEAFTEFKKQVELAESLDENSLAIFISKTGGERKFICDILNIVKKRKAKTVLITYKPDSYMAKNSDFLINIFYEENGLIPRGLISGILYTSVFNLIIMNYLKKIKNRGGK